MRRRRIATLLLCAALPASGLPALRADAPASDQNSTQTPRSWWARARALFIEEGSTCLISGGGIVPYFNSCIGCSLQAAHQCVEDMRKNVSKNVPSGCELDNVGALLGYGEDDDIKTPIQYHGPGFVKPNGGVNFNLSNPKNHRCCAYQNNYFTYAYPDALGCLANTGCLQTDVHLELLAECEHMCPPNVGQVKNPVSETADAVKVKAPYWVGTCSPFTRSAAAGLAPPLALLAVVLLR